MATRKKMKAAPKKTVKKVAPKKKVVAKKVKKPAPKKKVVVAKKKPVAKKTKKTAPKKPKAAPPAKKFEEEETQQLSFTEIVGDIEEKQALDKLTPEA